MFFLGVLVSVIDANKNQIYLLILICIQMMSHNFHTEFSFELCSIFYQAKSKMINFDRFTIGILTIIY